MWWQRKGRRFGGALNQVAALPNEFLFDNNSAGTHAWYNHLHADTPGDRREIFTAFRDTGGDPSTDKRLAFHVENCLQMTDRPLYGEASCGAARAHDHLVLFRRCKGDGGERSCDNHLFGSHRGRFFELDLTDEEFREGIDAYSRAEKRNSGTRCKDVPRFTFGCDFYRGNGVFTLF